MKLQFKILLLLSIIFGVVVFTFLSYQYIRIREKKLFYLESKKNQELVIDKVLQLHRIKYEQLLNDNSGWDEMVDFAAEPNLEWAKDNVDFFVNSFHLNFVQVYSKKMNLTYQFGDSTCLKHLGYLDQETIRTSFSDTAFVHYFQYCGNDLLEIFGATIVPAADADARKTPVQGYLFIGRKWNADYIADHSQATSYYAELIPVTDLSNFSQAPEKNYLTRSFKNNKGQTIAALVFSKKDPLKEDMAPFLYLSILVTLIALSVIIVFLFYFRKIILVPLGQISTTLNTHNSEHIRMLSSDTDEFKKLKTLILQFFWQEELLKKNNAILKENSATKDKLFSIIAHDLKNPVGNILAISELLTQSIKNKENETSEDLLTMIGSQAKETMNLLETLFDWAKSQSGQISYKPQLLNLQKIVEQVIEIYNPAALLKGITIGTELPDKIQVFTDPNMLNTILRNLITNAIKFTHQGGSIYISAEIKPDGTEITVADNGIGMDKKTQESLFHIDTTTTTTGTANEKGTGLGLIICKEFIEKHNGWIQVESEQGKGSKFIFNLPAI